MIEQAGTITGPAPNRRHRLAGIDVVISPVGQDFESKQAAGHVELEWTETEKVFDPEDVYGDAPNPTIL